MKPFRNDLLLRFMTLIVIVMLLIGCSARTSNIIVPKFPVLNGNCKRDLRVILQDYVAPIEQQRKR